MWRRKILIEKTIIDKLVELLTFLLLFGSLLFIALFYQDMPNQVPIYFNLPYKMIDDVINKDFLWIIPLMSGLVVIILYNISLRPWYFVYPTIIHPGNAWYNYRQASQMLRSLNLGIAVICLYLTLMSVLDGLGYKNSLNKYMGEVISLVMLGVPIIYVIRVLRYPNN